MSRERRSFDTYPGFKILEAAYNEVQSCGRLTRKQLISLLNQSCEDLGPNKEPAIDFLYDLSIFESEKSFIVCSELDLDLIPLLVSRSISKLEELHGNTLLREYESGEYYMDNESFHDCPGLRNLLIDLKYLNIGKNNRLYLTKKPKDAPKHLKKITPEDLRKIQKKQEEIGDIAEKYVMEYEKKRLINTPASDFIERISLLDVTAGFDILSFDTGYEQTPNRMIEVKGYSKQIGFYWSRNEREKAKLYGPSYHLYLVDISKKDHPDYKPTILDNPIKYLSENPHWSEEVEVIHMIYEQQ